MWPEKPKTDHARTKVRTNKVQMPGRHRGKNKQGRGAEEAQHFENQKLEPEVLREQK